MSENEVSIWQPISFQENWEESDTSVFDDLAPSWYKKRKEFEEGNKDYEEFIVRLKRQHAIETGIVEKLYDLSEGITQTLIKDGFVESYISHNDSNIPPKKLMQYLHDHFEAMDFIFDLVKSNRPLTKGFIKELHQLVTQNQDYTEAIDSLGNRVTVDLIKGEFKRSDNNPKRADGTIFLYCPPLHVESEIDKMIAIYNEQADKGLNPIVLSAWVHHAFTQIHPFQDGNGRIARLLASLILIKNGLLPFTVKRTDKVKYIEALESADNHIPQKLVSFFSQEQKKSIEIALNFKSERKFNSLSDLAALLNDKIDESTSKQKEQRESNLKVQRDKIFKIIYDLLGSIQKELFQVIPMEKARININSVLPSQAKYFWHTHQISEYASVHSYYFNRHMPRGWFSINFAFPNQTKYSLVISVHHYGYEDDAVAIGSFLEFYDSSEGESEDKKLIPINLEPFTISLEGIGDRTSANLDSYLHDTVKVCLSLLINEIN